MNFGIKGINFSSGRFHACRELAPAADSGYAPGKAQVLEFMANFP